MYIPAQNIAIEILANGYNIQNERLKCRYGQSHKNIMEYYKCNIRRYNHYDIEKVYFRSSL